MIIKDSMLTFKHLNEQEKKETTALELNERYFIKSGSVLQLINMQNVLYLHSCVTGEHFLLL